MSQLYAFHCLDGADAPALRERLLGEHLAHVEAHLADYAVAGPLKDGDVTIGSLLVIRAADAQGARARFEADPYFAAGVWRSVHMSQFLGVAGDWVGGAAWKQG